MHSVQSPRGESAKGGAFGLIGPLVLAVVVLVLSWTGLFVVISDLVDAASRSLLTTEAVQE